MMLHLIALLLRQRLVAQRVVSAGHAAPPRERHALRRAALWAGSTALALGAAAYVAQPGVWREASVRAPAAPVEPVEPATLRLRVAAVDLGATPLLVYLDRPEGGAVATAASAATPATVQLSSSGSVFEPAFQVAPLAARMEIGNADAVAHNTHVFQGAEGRRRTLFNVALPQQDVPVARVLARTGLFEVRCDLHAWMRAAVFVPPNVHHLLVREAGEFELRDIAPGRWRLHVWQAERGDRVRLIELAPGATEALEIAAR
jgi:plastocyanin